MGFPGISEVKNPPVVQETWVHPWVWKILCRREWLPTPLFLPGELHVQRCWRSAAHGYNVGFQIYPFSITTLPTKVCLVKAMVFPVVMYGCESWTVKKSEHQKIDAFELWCWRRLLRVPWTARRSNQSILKEISPGCSLEGLMLKLKLQYFGHLMRRVDSLEKTLIGRDWGQEEKGMTENEMAGGRHQLDGHEFE